MPQSSRIRAPNLLVSAVYPFNFYGTVVSGFGRGGRQLGCPTGMATTLPCFSAHIQRICGR